ncbi:TPA: hypothetical protein ACH3X2_011191 [Trebouxia sp. C0005]
MGDYPSRWPVRYSVAADLGIKARLVGQLQNGAGSASSLHSASGGREDTVQISAAGYDNPAEHQPAGGLGQALRGLGLPTEEEVKMVLRNVKSFPDPRKLPDFKTQRGKQSRPLAITDVVKPVRSAEEKTLYHELYLLHTKKNHTDWLPATAHCLFIMYEALKQE